MTPPGEILDKTPPGELLGDAELALIRLRHATGTAIGRLADDYRQSRACIAAIVAGRRWRHLAGDRAAGAQGDLFAARRRRPG